jgi:hypothetical protein
MSWYPRCKQIKYRQSAQPEIKALLDKKRAENLVDGSGS